MSDDLEPSESREPHEPRQPHAQEQPAEPEALSRQQQALHERAQQLGATAAELQAALDTLALQAEAVLRRLRGHALH